MAAGVIITLLIVIPMCIVWGIGIDEAETEEETDDQD